MISRERCIRAYEVRLQLDEHIRHYINFGSLILDLSKEYKERGSKTLKYKKATHEDVWHYLKDKESPYIYISTKIKGFAIKSSRTSYLMAARKVMPNLLEIGRNFDDFVEMFDQGAPIPEKFRELLEAVWAIDTRLKTGGRQDVETIAGITESKLPIFEKVVLRSRPKPIRKRPEKSTITTT